MPAITTGAAVVSVLNVPVKPVPQSYVPANVFVVPPVYAPAGASTTLRIRSEPVANRLATVHVTLADVVAAALSARVTRPAVTGTTVPAAVRHTQAPSCTYPVSAAPVPTSLRS